MVGIAVAMVRGREADCHCFGQLHSAPVGWRTLARNGGLAAVAAFVVVEGWRSPGVSATGWVARVSTGWLVAGGAGVVVAALVGFQVWFSLQLLSQNGRTLGRLEALEATISELARLPGPGGAVAPPPRALGAGLSGGGLPLGSRAPAFALGSSDGQQRSLHELLAAGRPVLLLFTDPGCGPCEALMPDVSRWEREHAARLTIALIASGDEDRNREKAERHGLKGLLFQSEREVSDAYKAYGTPTAVVVGFDGLIASPVVGGAEAIGTLVAQTTGAVPNRRQDLQDGNPSSVGRAASSPPDVSRVGQPAPDLTLTSLDGAAVSLADLYQTSTLALFWNPGCGFCQRMLPDLRAFEASPPDGSPAVVVISVGDADRVREEQIRSTVILDPHGEAMRAFQAGGTPTGVLIQHGRIASPVVAGADAVFKLATATAHALSDADLPDELLNAVARDGTDNL